MLINIASATSFLKMQKDVEENRFRARALALETLMIACSATSAANPKSSAADCIKASAPVRASPIVKSMQMATTRDLVPFLSGTATDIDRSNAVNLHVGAEAMKGHHRAMLGGVASFSQQDWARVRKEKGSCGVVYTFGENSDGQLGQGNVRNLMSPTLVSSLRDRVVLQIVAGGMHSMALLDDGSCIVFGSNQRGQLGRQTIGPCLPFPTALFADSSEATSALSQLRIVRVAAGFRHSAVLTGTMAAIKIVYEMHGDSIYVVSGICNNVSDGGDVWMWGDSAYGALGPTRSSRDRNSASAFRQRSAAQFKPSPVIALSGMQVVSLSLGKQFSLALTGTAQNPCMMYK